MADSYYQSQYSAPPPSQAQYYASEAQHHYPGQDPPQHGSPGYYPPDPQQYGTPPYRGTPPPPNTQLAPYQEPYDGRRSSDAYSESSHHHHHHHRSSDAGSYDEPARSHSRSVEHRGSVGSERGLGHGPSGKHHHAAKDIGASLLGAAVGGLAGHEVGHGGVATLIGAVAGGVVGHELESRHEKHKEERERRRRESGSRGYPEGPYGTRQYAEGRRARRRDLSRGMSESSGSETDSSYERRRHHGH